MLDTVKTIWTVPAGLILICFYGVHHFNTPDYNVYESIFDSAARSKNQLTCLAPPRFTTDRRRFRRYMQLYVAVLMLEFFLFVFCYSVVEDSLRAAGWLNGSIGPGDVSRLQYRVVLALLAIMGVLPSVPVLKDYHALLLSSLHKRALIPDSARLLAQRLQVADFEPAAEVSKAARKLLTMRDTKRVAEGNASGSLESTFLRALEIKVTLDQYYLQERNLEFQARLKRDLDELSEQSAQFIEDLKRTLALQQTKVSDTEPDIDAYLENAAHSDKICADLISQRAELLKVTNLWIFRLCLMTAMCANATCSRPERMQALLNELGFKVTVEKVPAWDLEGLAKVSGSIFVGTLFFTAGVIRLFDWLGLVPANPAHPPPGGPGFFMISMMTTLLYAFVIIAATLVKRHAGDGANGAPSDNIVSAFLAYAVGSVIFFVIFYLPIRNSPDISILDHTKISFGQFNLFVAGYFTSKYIGRAAVGKSFRYSYIARQAFFQGVATAVTLFLLPEPKNANELQKWAFEAFIVCQSALGGALFSYFVQKFYQQSDSVCSNAEGGKTIGDVRVFANRSAHSPALL